MCDGGYELVGSGGACGAKLTDVESSHCPSNPILDGKIRMLNENDDDGDDDDDDFVSKLTLVNLCLQISGKVISSSNKVLVSVLGYDSKQALPKHRLLGRAEFHFYKLIKVINVL